MDIRGKAILLFAPKTFSLHTQIIDELQRQGAIVDYVEDNMSARFNPQFQIWKQSLASWIYYPLCKLYHRWINPNKKWIMSNLSSLSRTNYDVLFCINGFSFDKYLIYYLKAHNPDIVSVLYLWDSYRLYDFSKNAAFFNHVYTFDKVDADENKINYLPLFWQPPSSGIKTDSIPKYQILCVGSIHLGSDRYKIIKSIIPQLDRNGINYYIKLFVAEYDSFWMADVRYLLAKITKNEEYTLIYQIKKKQITEDFFIYFPVSHEDLEQKFKESSCILDIELPTQTGLSHRLMYALAMDKKIITTNVHVKDTPFYDKRQVFILDRDNVEIPMSFLTEDFIASAYSKSELNKLRIDNWLISIFQNLK
ncbi:hypothetical protein SAMD00024442_25_13 [Candidatus Symbiothrix dinenymphae]|nr:hypothetical protein SAMD00024442_25_13 [Candidatus Symbiothrix dinenymphae]